MTSLFVSTLLILGLVADALCAQNVSCISAQDPQNITITQGNVCNAVGFTASNPNQETYHIHLNYAERNDITEVNILNQSIEYIPKQIFIDFPHVRNLTISANVTELQPGDFVDALNLAKLVLAENKIKVIRTNVFSPYTTASNANTILQELTDLSLSNNEISEIDDYSFYGLNNLKRIDLLHNQLKVIRRLAFAGLPALEELDLFHNEIETIEDGALDFPYLNMLILAGNHLKRLSDDIFQNTPRLRFIFLAQNGLEHIGQSLYEIPEATSIGLSFNRIQDLDLAAFAKMPKLKVLIASSSGFTFSSSKIDDGQTWDSPLLALDIGTNNLSDVRELRKLRIFSHLETLCLDGNLYTDLGTDNYPTLKDMLPSLKSIFISKTGYMNCTKLKILSEKLESKGVETFHDC